MTTNPDDKKKREKPPRVERDIFGDEYVGAQKVFRLTLNVSQLPEGARQLFDVLSALPPDLIDWTQVFTEALHVVDADFWQKKLQELTPIEWKFFEALRDEEFRNQVQTILEGKEF